jgi:hypothetical protein
MRTRVSANSPRPHNQVIEWAPQDYRLAAGSWDGSITIWDVRDERSLSHLLDHLAISAHLALVPRINVSRARVLVIGVLRCLWCDMKSERSSTSILTTRHDRDTPHTDARCTHTNTTTGAGQGGEEQRKSHPPRSGAARAVLHRGQLPLSIGGSRSCLAPRRTHAVRGVRRWLRVRNVSPCRMLQFCPPPPPSTHTRTHTRTHTHTHTRTHTHTHTHTHTRTHTHTHNTRTRGHCT